MKNKQILIPLVILCLAAIILTLGLYANRSGKTSSPKTPNQPKAPVRIVSLAPNLTEILFELGLGEKIIAVSKGSNYPPQTAEKQKIGTFWQPNTEVIIATRPDLVVTLWFEQQKSVADTLTNLGYSVLVLKIENIQELLSAIQKIGTATGCEQKATQLAENISTQLNNFKSKSDSAGKTKVLWVIQPEPVRIAGRKTFINELVELAGGENAIGPTIQQYPPISTEEILACGAEVIIQSAMENDNIAKQLEAAKVFWSKFPNLPAVRNNRIYVLKSDTILRLGPRLPQGVEMIAQCLYPQDTSK